MLRAAVHARSPDGLAMALSLLREPTTENDLIEETTFAFWVCKLLSQLGDANTPEAKDMLAAVKTRLNGVQQVHPKDFPVALQAVLA